MTERATETPILAAETGRGEAKEAGHIRHMKGVQLVADYPRLNGVSGSKMRGIYIHSDGVWRSNQLLDASFPLTRITYSTLFLHWAVNVLRAICTYRTSDVRLQMDI